jgi:hypothetical protein
MRRDGVAVLTLLALRWRGGWQAFHLAWHESRLGVA